MSDHPSSFFIIRKFLSICDVVLDLKETLLPETVELDACAFRENVFIGFHAFFQSGIDILMTDDHMSKIRTFFFKESKLFLIHGASSGMSGYSKACFGTRSAGCPQDFFFRFINGVIAGTDFTDETGLDLVLAPACKQFSFDFFFQFIDIGIFDDLRKSRFLIEACAINDIDTAFFTQFFKDIDPFFFDVIGTDLRRRHLHDRGTAEMTIVFQFFPFFIDTVVPGRKKDVFMRGYETQFIDILFTADGIDEVTHGFPLSAKDKSLRHSAEP